MRVLALDTSTHTGRIALVEVPGSGPYKILAEDSFASERSHNSLLFGPLARFLAEFPPPEKIVAGLGPGSYTGIRIGIAAAHGLATALGIPWTGHASLPALEETPEFHVFGNARRGEMFHARVANGEMTGEPLIFPTRELEEHLAGPGEVPAFTTDPIPAHPLLVPRSPSASLLARLAARAPVQSGPIEPLYLRAPYITLPKHPAPSRHHTDSPLA